MRQTRVWFARNRSERDLVLKDKVQIVAVVLTFNEEVNLSECLESLQGWVDRIVVVDSCSTDSTVHIAASYGAHVLVHPFDTHTAQWQWAIKNLPRGSSNWVLALDADQRVTESLAREISELLSGDRMIDEDIAGFYISRRQIFRGRWIRHGGYYPKYLLKLFRKDRVYFDELDLVDHHFYVRGRTRRLKHDLIEANHKEDDLTFWVDKHRRYAGLMAEEEYLRRTRRLAGASTVKPALFGDLDERRVWLKQLWIRMPLFIRPWLYFLHRYVLRLGFLDGREGLIFHFLQACWFRFMVDAYLYDLQRSTPVHEPRDSTVGPDERRLSPPGTRPVVWLTGLSSAGKTTIAEALRTCLIADGSRVEVLDGDVVRKNLSKDLGFSREDRNENVRRISYVASMLARQGVVVIVAAIAPSRQSRSDARRACDRFIEVYVNAPLAVCEQRDVKGLYRKARRGEIHHFTGIDDPYEPPLHPEVECRTAEETVSESVSKVLKAIDNVGSKNDVVESPRQAVAAQAGRQR